MEDRGSRIEDRGSSLPCSILYPLSSILYPLFLIPGWCFLVILRQGPARWSVLGIQAQGTAQPAQAFLLLAAAQQQLAERVMQGRVIRRLHQVLGNNLVETLQVFLHLLEPLPVKLGFGFVAVV